MPNPEYQVKIHVEENGESTNSAAAGFRIRNVGEINENLESGGMSTSMSQIFGRDEENVPDTTAADADPERTPSPENLRPPADDPEQPPEISNSSNKRPFQAAEVDEAPSPSKRTRTDDSEATTSTSLNPPVDEVVRNIKPDPDSTTALPATTSSTQPAATVKTEPDDVKPEVKPDPNLRPSCEHGIRCFRYSPEHRRDFAHPQDPDYRRPSFPDPPSGTPPCPWGASCYRRNPAHFHSLSHPSSSECRTSHNA